MAGTVKTVRLESPTARSRLASRRQPHWQSLVEDKTRRLHLGWQRDKAKLQGRWMLRRYLGHAHYTVQALGLANDGGVEADGKHTLTHAQAQAMALTIVATADDTKNKGPLTVRAAWSSYIEAKRDKGQPTSEAISAGNTHILPALGDLVVANLDVKRLRQWHASVAKMPAQLRSRKGKPQYRPAPATDDERRARRATANRTLTYLKACLNLAYKDGEVASRDAWDIKLEAFKKVDAARKRFLSIEEARRLVNAATPDFRPLVVAALETGCRYGELTRLKVHDFNIDAGTVHVQHSKSGEPRDVYLSAAGFAFFQRHCLGRGGHELMFVHADGTPWVKSDQGEPMQRAVERAQITPRISFHGLRHSWASLAVMNRMPLIVVARNLGHANTRMVEKHYGHLAKNYVSETVLAHAPDYGLAIDATVVPLRTGT
jgi:integrase